MGEFREASGRDGDVRVLRRAVDRVAGRGGGQKLRRRARRDIGVRKIQYNLDDSGVLDFHSMELPVSLLYRYGIKLIDIGQQLSEISINYASFACNSDPFRPEDSGSMR